MHAGQFCLEYVLWIRMCVCLLMITGCYYSTNKRFRGELFGIGSNHTKYKSKGYPNTSSASSQPQQLQYNPAVRSFIHALTHLFFV